METTPSPRHSGSIWLALLLLTALGLANPAGAEHPAEIEPVFDTADALPSVHHARLLTLIPEDALDYAMLLAQPGIRPVRYQSALLHALPPGSQVRMPLSEALEISLTHERTVRNSSGSRTWIGRLTGFPPIYRVIITDDGEHVHGRIMTPRGLYFLETVDGVQRLHNPRASGVQVPPFVDDAIPPPYHLLEPEDDVPPQAQSMPPSAASTDLATVDLLIAYTPGMVTRYGLGLQVLLALL